MCDPDHDLQPNAVSPRPLRTGRAFALVTGADPVTEEPTQIYDGEDLCPVRQPCRFPRSGRLARRSAPHITRFHTVDELYVPTQLCHPLQVALQPFTRNVIIYAAAQRQDFIRSLTFYLILPRL